MNQNEYSSDLPAELKQAVTTLSERQFDQLIFFLFDEVENDAAVTFIPEPREGDLNLKVSHDSPILTIQYAVTLVQQIGADSEPEAIIQSVGDSVDQSEQIDTGVVVTASSLSEKSENFAADAGINSIDGDRLVTLLIDHSLGIKEQNGTVTLDKAFWDLFRGQTRSGPIDTLEIPQADSLSRLRQTLSAIANGNHHKEEIAREIERMSGENFESRQADYYSTAGWLLGMLHKERRSRQVAGRGRWGLTRIGQTYLSALDSGNHATATRVLSNQIRGIEILRRILNEIDDGGSMSREELTEIIDRESELSGTTVGRRASTVSSWLSELPEITKGTGSQYVAYSDVSRQPVETSSIHTETEPTTGDKQTVGTSDEDEITDENAILDEMMETFKLSD